MQTDDPIILGIRNHIVSIEPTTGQELWRKKLKNGSMVTTCIRGNDVYAGVGGELFRLRISDGEIMWQNEMPRLSYVLITFAADPNEDASDLIVGMNGHVVSIDAATGRELWRTKLKRSSLMTVCLHGSSTVLAGVLGEVYALNRSVGNVLWSAPLKRLGHGMISFGSNETAMAFAAQAQAAAAT